MEVIGLSLSEQGQTDGVDNRENGSSQTGFTPREMRGLGHVIGRVPLSAARLEVSPAVAVTAGWMPSREAVITAGGILET
jgi:hypothetical protein